MKTNIVIQKFLIAIGLSIFLAGQSFAVGQKVKPAIRFKSLSMPSGFDQTRVNAVGEALGFQGWPKTGERYVAPVINKSLLSDAELITHESTSYNSVQFDRNIWGKYKLSWRSLTENEQPLPEELPSEHKERLLEKISPEQLNDPEFVQEYLNRNLESYRESQRYRLDGEIDVEVCLAPSSRAAQEYLVSTMTENQMTTEGLVGTYGAASQPEGLGDISFITESRNKDTIEIKLVRGNICLNIRANGNFVDKALPLAWTIDDMIVEQPPLTYQQLLERRPLITIAPEHKGEREVSYDLSVPAGQEIVRVLAFIDGQYTAAKDGKISLAGKKGKVKVKLIAITRNLLASSFEKELFVDE